MSKRTAKTFFTRITRTKQNLVTNTTAVDGDDIETNLDNGSYQEITANTQPIVRYEELEGRKYMVIPTVMITEGVHAGSDGPLYYPANELAKTPAVWNHKPIVVYHPTQNGESMSACDKTVMEKQKIGLMLNTKFVPSKGSKPGKLKTEAWLETAKVKQVDPRVLDAIKNNQMMEVSTGLFTDNETKSGLFGNKPYDNIARNYRPDHLAILPDQKGACAISAGAGLLRNSSNKNGEPFMKTKKIVVNSLITSNATSWAEDDREYLMEQEMEVLEKMLPIPLPLPKKEETAAAVVANAAAAAVVDPKAVVDATVKVATLEDLVSNASPEVQEAFQSMRDSAQRERAGLVATIVANRKNTFKKEFLEKSMPLEQLRAVALMVKADAQPTMNNYAGMADGGAVHNGDGEQTVTEQKPLGLPVMNFSMATVDTGDEE